MRAISVNHMRTNDAGKQVVDAFVIADTTPAELPTTGENIIGMNEDQVFAPFSMIYIVGDAPVKLYIANESGVFVAQ